MKPYLESEVYVPNDGDPATAKLWIIGDFPEFDDVQSKQPFIGRAGGLLRETLGRYNISNNDVFYTNLCHYRPKNNIFGLLSKTPELASGLSELTKLLTTHRPNLIVTAGNDALNILCAKEGIAAYRGSILKSSFGHKCIPIYHPSYILRDAGSFPIFAHDIELISNEMQHDIITEWKWDFHYGDDIELPFLVDEFEQAEYLSVDIESVKESSNIICVGFAISGTRAISIPLIDGTTRNWIQRLLSSNAKKIFHFGTFDVSMLRINGFTVINYTDDTIIAAHILEPELPRDLGFITSIYTKIPYYKTEGKKNIPSDTKGWSVKRNKEDLYIYNCKDVVATYQCYFAMCVDLITEKLDDLYRYEMEVVGFTIEMGLNGLLRDNERHDTLKVALEIKQTKFQTMLNMICGTVVNINSPKQMTTVLFKGLGLPERRNQEGNLTADNDALVSLISHIKTRLNELKTEEKKNEWKLKLAFVEISIKLRGITKMLNSYFNIPISLDGRVRSTYKAAGTESGRLSASKFVDGTGLNSQTLPREAIEL